MTNIYIAQYICSENAHFFDRWLKAHRAEQDVNELVLVVPFWDCTDGTSYLMTRNDFAAAFPRVYEGFAVSWTRVFNFYNTVSDT